MPSQELVSVLLQLLCIFMLAPVAVLMVLLRNDRDKRRHAHERQRLHELLQMERSQALLEAEVYARQQLAADLHDELGLHFTLLMAALSKAANESGAPPDLQGIVSQGQCFYKRMRELVHRIRQYDRLQDGLLPAVHSVANDVKNMGRFALHVECPDTLPPLHADHCLFILCMVQEGLNNVIKHAHARRVELKLSAEGAALVLLIADDGRGFDTTIAPNGHGLRNMQLRARLLGGNAAVQSTPGGGTTLRIIILTNTTNERKQPTPARHLRWPYPGGAGRQPPPGYRIVENVSG